MINNVKLIPFKYNYRRFKKNKQKAKHADGNISEDDLLIKHDHNTKPQIKPFQRQQEVLYNI